MSAEEIKMSDTNTEEADRCIQILLVEDNEDDVVIIKEVFKTAKLVHIANVVYDGQEALSYLRQEGPYQHCSRPDLLILDINMPKTNGWEVLEEIKRDPKLRSLPVVMLTSSEQDQDILRAYDHGACTYIVKPITYQSFMEIAKTFSFYWGLYAKVPLRADHPAGGKDTS